MIDSVFIKSFCLKEFQSNYRLASDGTELIVPSIFVENDYKRHMSINLETGLWQCFKSGQRGNFFKLYATITGTSYKQVYEKFMFECFINGKGEEEKKIEVVGTVPQEELDNFIPLDLDTVYDEPLMALASESVHARSLENYKFYVAKEGKYGGRLIIPYFDFNERMFFFQARTLLGQQPKYLNCKSVKSSWILYPFDYDSNAPLYITEGAIDAMTLRRAGFNATSTISCQVSNVQMEQLKHYNGPLVVAFDRDDAGLKGLVSFINIAYKHKIGNCYFVCPPKGIKDWNQLYIRKGDSALIDALLKKEELNKVSSVITEL